jgi:hypothetical protein
MVEEIDNPAIYSELAKPHILRNATIVIMLDFTAPWNFIVEIEKWVKFIYELQRMAQLSIADLETMAARRTPLPTQSRPTTRNSAILSSTKTANLSTPAFYLECIMGLRGSRRRSS